MELGPRKLRPPQGNRIIGICINLQGYFPAVKLLSLLGLKRPYIFYFANSEVCTGFVQDC